MANPIASTCKNILQNNSKLLYSRLLTTTSIKKNDTNKDIKETVVERPKYGTAQDFRDYQNKNKFRGAEDSSSGRKPTNFQRRMLVWTGMYKSKDEIPEYLTPGTMMKLSDRTRIAFIVVGCFVLFAIGLVGEKLTVAKIEKDKKLGSVNKN